MTENADRLYALLRTNFGQGMIVGVLLEMIPTDRLNEMLTKMEGLQTYGDIGDASPSVKFDI